MINPFRPITTALLPTFENKDYFLALKLLFQPWNYFNEKWENDLILKIKKYFERTGSPLSRGLKVFLFDSGRTSLYAFLKSLEFSEGDEVYLQAFTCVAVSNPIKWAGATPVYVDADQNLNMDYFDLEKKISEKGKVVIVQHTFGKRANIEKISEIAKKHDLILIEDLAHAIGAKWQGKPLGTVGDAAILSFGRDKVISGVCGGALLLNDEKYAPLVKQVIAGFSKHTFLWIFQVLLYPILMFFVLNLYSFLNLGKALHKILYVFKITPRVLTFDEKGGRKPKKFFAGLPGAISHLVSFQFDRLDDFVSKRRKIAKIYAEKLKMPFDPDQTYLRFNVFVDNPSRLRKFAALKNVYLGDWYDTAVAPRSVDLKSAGYQTGSCPKAEEFCRTIVNLPTNPGMRKEEVEKVIKILSNTN